MKNYLLLCVILLTGCASAGLNGGCLTIQGSGISTPWTGSGKVNANGFICGMSGISTKGTAPTYEEVKEMSIAFINKQDMAGKMNVSGPGTIQFIPSK